MSFRILKRAKLPEQINYNGKILKYNAEASAKANENNKHWTIAMEMKLAGKNVIYVDVSDGTKEQRYIFNN